ncbi:MAG: hypothetical protein V1781_09585 [Bacteroidota bacterium]
MAEVTWRQDITALAITFEMTYSCFLSGLKPVLSFCFFSAINGGVNLFYLNAPYSL